MISNNPHADFVADAMQKKNTDRLFFRKIQSVLIIETGRGD